MGLASTAKEVGNIKSVESSFSPKLLNHSYLGKNEGQKLMKSVSMVASESRIAKIESKEIKKIRKSIRLIYEFTDRKFFLNLPKSIKSQITFDFKFK